MSRELPDWAVSVPKPSVPGDGKVVMAGGRRLYPCEARAEMAATEPYDPGGRHRSSPPPWMSYWPEPISEHTHDA